MNKSIENKSNLTKEIDSIHSISTVLQTGLDKRTIKILADLIESNIDPESLADGNNIAFLAASFYDALFLFMLYLTN
jgi:hypothetical protein